MDASARERPAAAMTMMVVVVTSWRWMARTHRSYVPPSTYLLTHLHMPVDASDAVCLRTENC
jgi:hypothetical protein